MPQASTMKAVRLHEHGGPDVLRYVDVPMDEPGPGEVLVKGHARAVNQRDLRYRSGRLPPPLPFQLGRDAADEVVALGAGVGRRAVGDRVVQMPHSAFGHCPMCLRGRDNLCVATSYPGHRAFGGCAEYVVRSEHAVLPTPETIGYEPAAATLRACTTPLDCATRRAPVGVGDTVVITGASGGLATASVQLARLFGARTIGTTTKP